MKKVLLVLGLLVAVVYCEDGQLRFEDIFKTFAPPQFDPVDEETVKKFADEFTEGKHCDPDWGRLKCTCHGTIRKMKMQGINLVEVLDRLSTPGHCNKDFESRYCEFIRKCSNCTASVRWCKPLRLTGTFYHMSKERDIPDPRNYVKEYHPWCVAGSFNCQDGNCIPDSEVCDGRYDCSNKRDELNCVN